jgi:hypothetical protein
MNTQQNQLKSVLQALALPVTGQLRLYPNDECKVERLIQEFDQFEPLLLAEWAGCLTTAQIDLITLLRRGLMHVCGEAGHNCTDVTLRRSKAWRKVRLLARSALLGFNWPLVAPTQFEQIAA